MFVTIITDCKEENEKGRQLTRWASLGFNNINLVGVDSSLGINSTIEAAGNLIDILDASDGGEGVVFANVAPRGHIDEDGYNGTDFSYFYHKRTLVISTVRGYTLSLVKKFNLVDKVSVVKLAEVLEQAFTLNLIDRYGVEYIKNSQFRSFDYVPRIAKWIVDGHQFAVEELSLSTRSDIPNSVWCIDAFGNAKTTITSSETILNHGDMVKTNIGDLCFYNRLKDIPQGKPGIYIGSSGVGTTRFLEIAVQAKEGSAEKEFGLKTGDEIILGKI
jgi:S-adenosyl-l-methionine hydroxide adenosyltransferase